MAASGPVERERIRREGSTKGAAQRRLDTLQIHGRERIDGSQGCRQGSGRFEGLRDCVTGFMRTTEEARGRVNDGKESKEQTNSVSLQDVLAGRTSIGQTNYKNGQ